MTKPINFPGRKNQRRIEALERLNADVMIREAVDDEKWPQWARTFRKNLERKIISQNAALMVRTKKIRDTG